MEYVTINENLMIELINESIIKYNNSFKDILFNMVKSYKNDLALNLVYMMNSEVDIDANHIDVSDKNDMITFLSDKKVTSSSTKYIIVNDGLEYKTWIDKYKELGFKKTTHNELPNGTIGTIKTSFKRENNNGEHIKICHFIADDGSGECIIEFDGLDILDDNKIKRGEMKIGRWLNAMISKGNIKLSHKEKEIEEFVNLYKSIISTEKDMSNNILEIKGDDIKQYYLEEMYSKNTGTLGNSCMKEHRCQDYLGLYTKNPDKISLLVLLDDNGGVMARALLWKIDSPDIYFMDRIYATMDYLTNVFKNYAISKGYYYKNKQSYNIDDIVFNHNNQNGLKMYTQLNNFKFNKYPYLDTLCFMTKDGLLNNDKHLRSYYKLRGTYGEEYVCSDCEGTQFVLCPECGGYGCDDCDFEGQVDCPDCKNIMR